MLLKAHDVMTPDRHIKYLSRQYVKVHAQAYGVQSPFISIFLRQHCNNNGNGRLRVQGSRKQDQPWDKLAKSRDCWERPNTRDAEL